MTIALPRLDRSTAAERGITLADFLVPVAVAERTPTRVRHIALIVAGALVVKTLYRTKALFETGEVPALEKNPSARPGEGDRI